MGLDNYWTLPEGKEVKFDPPLKLVGGLFSGHGEGSFRGKVYNDFFEQVTGFSLYTNLTPEQVDQASIILDSLGDDQIQELAEEYLDDWYDPEQHVRDLQRMFYKYACEGASLEASY